MLASTTSARPSRSRTSLPLDRSTRTTSAEPATDMGEAVVYTSGASRVLVYRSDFAGTNKATAATCPRVMTSTVSSTISTARGCRSSSTTCRERVARGTSTRSARCEASGSRIPTATFSRSSTSSGSTPNRRRPARRANGVPHRGTPRPTAPHDARPTASGTSSYRSRRGRCSQPRNSPLVLATGVGGNLESGNTTVLSDSHVDVLDNPVGQEDHLVLARVQRRPGVAEGHAVNVEVPATDRRDNDPDGNRFPLFAEPQKLLREFAPKKSRSNTAAGTLEPAERFVQNVTATGSRSTADGLGMGAVAPTGTDTRAGRTRLAVTGSVTAPNGSR